MMRGRAPTLVLGLLLIPLFGQSPAAPNLDIVITDAKGQAISGVRVELTGEQRTVKAADTDDLGHVSFSHLAPGHYGIRAKKAGFETVDKQNLELASSGLLLEVTMVAALTRSESIEVRGAVMEVEENTSLPNKLPPGTVRELPNRPATVA